MKIFWKIFYSKNGKNIKYSNIEGNAKQANIAMIYEDENFDICVRHGNGTKIWKYGKSDISVISDISYFGYLRFSILLQ